MPLANADASLRRTRLRQPGLRLSVVLRASGPRHAADAPSAQRVHVRARRADGPVRVSLYLDGCLVQAMRARGAGEFALPDLPGGRHTLTVRAIDSAGRWGGASLIVAGG